ncbi:aminotransferase class V-fold PLP-dependent enzyme [Candidatus Gracilibacteria bacterium]|nr:aminotransferase class V-fold PLP-dependent enzyme [Candidatus Gracilibacteria bacterium]
MAGSALLRQQFLLRPDITFLNHGSFGACPQPVFAAYQRWQRSIEDDPVDFFMRRWRPSLTAARSALATFVGVDADDLVYVENTTYGLNALLRSLALRPDDEVLTSDHEYGAIDRLWRYTCAQRGARYVVRPIVLPVTTAEQFVDDFWAGVTPRTRVIALSHITSATALTFPIAQICARARAAGILTVIDGAHVPGQIDLDLTTLGADFYVGNCHKWLCAPKGAGFLYVRREHQAALDPLIIGWGWQADDPGESQFIDYFERVGTNDPSAYLATPTAIEFQTNHDWPRVRAACHALLCTAEQRIGALSELAPLSPSTPEWFTQMRSIPLPPHVDMSLSQRLWQEYAIEVPTIMWGERRFVRVSIQAYNTPDDVERLVDALTRILV